jgi:SAM-dependent methyltransferase
METIQNVLEYYDELFSVSEAQKEFYADLMKQYEKPVKFLRIGCGTGYFEHLLARSGHDVTGIDTSKSYLESANLRRRTQLMAIRFFLMSSTEMIKFLGKNFYNIISCLNNRIIFLHEVELLKKFFIDCKSLLSKNGSLILQLTNFNLYKNKKQFNLPDVESIRAKLYTDFYELDGKPCVTQTVETANKKILPIVKDVQYYPLTSQEIENFAKDAGFSSVKFYSSFVLEPFTGSEEEVVAVLQ